jgi:hypothetical protein
LGITYSDLPPVQAILVPWRVGLIIHLYKKIIYEKVEAELKRRRDGVLVNSISFVKALVVGSEEVGCG